MTSIQLEFLVQLDYLSTQEIKDLIEGFTTIDVLLDPEDFEKWRELND